MGLTEHVIEFRKRVLDTKSPSFCGKKWYDATIWLHSGQTASCFHTPSHKMNLEAVKQNPAAIHNTENKKHDRRMMQLGEKPKNCEFCWNIEDLGSISDRVWHSQEYSELDLQHAFDDINSSDFPLQTLEMSFSRNCQLACSYCCPSISTAWGKDIDDNGAYIELFTEHRGMYTHNGSDRDLYNDNQVNPYVEAFFKWWASDLHKTLKLIRLTGGEPLMSKDIWRFLDLLGQHKSLANLRIHVESNLGHNTKTIQRLLSKLKDIDQHITVVASAESIDAKAEYIRNGINWQQFSQNVEALSQSDVIDDLIINGTVSALSIDGLVEFLNYILTFKKKYGPDKLVTTMTPVRFPTFQSPSILPDRLKNLYADELQTWLDVNDKYISEFEVDNLNRIVKYLRSIDNPHSEASYTMDAITKDFKNFFSQYDQRRNLNLIQTFPRLADWYYSI